MTVIRSLISVKLVIKFCVIRIEHSDKRLCYWVWIIIIIIIIITIIFIIIITIIVIIIIIIIIINNQPVSVVVNACSAHKPDVLNLN